MTGSIGDIATPALLLDVRRLRQNCERGRRLCRQLGVLLRPHMKTAKSARIARLAVDPAYRAIAVSTLKEAEYFILEGFDDIQYAVCLTPDKLPHAFNIARRIRRFSVFIDSVDMAERIAAYRDAPPRSLGVWIEIDSGEHRTGVPPVDPELVAIARRLTTVPSVRFEGVATHAGQAYEARTTTAIADIAELERQAIVAASDQLKQFGIHNVSTSVGSTPTLAHATRGAGITEFRAGVYMLGDLFQAGIGSIAQEDIAVSVLSTVMSHQRAARRFFIDAGGLALSKDRSTASLATDCGYGALLDAEGRRYGDLIVNEVAQEHGFVELEAGTAPPSIGTQLRVIPNHACMTAAMYEEYTVIDGSHVVARWPRINGW